MSEAPLRFITATFIFDGHNSAINLVRRILQDHRMLKRELASRYLPDDQAKPELIRLFELEKSITSDIWLLIHPDMRQCTRLITFRDFIMDSFRSDPLFQKYGIRDDGDSGNIRREGEGK